MTDASTVTIVTTRERLSGVVQSVGRRPNDIPRRRWESLLVFGLFTLAYAWFGNWLISDMHVVGFETLDRFNRALMVWHNDPPKLSAVGFDYPPLTILLISPLTIFSGLASSLLVVPLASAVFAAFTMVMFNTMMRRAQVLAPVRAVTLLALGLNPLVVLYAASGARHFMWIAFVVAALGSLFAWYVTADIRFVMIAGLAFAVAALSGYSSLLWFVVSAIMVGAILARLGADGTEIEGTTVGFAAPTVYVVALWTAFNLLLVFKPFNWISASSDAASSGGLEAFSAVELLEYTGRLVLYGAPIAIVVLPALVFAGVARRNSFALWLAVILFLSIIVPALSVALKLTDSPMIMRNALPILLFSMIGAIWLARSAGDGASLVSALLVVGLIVSIPWTFQAMKTYIMTFDEYRQRVKSLWGEAVTDDAETTQELRLQHLDFIETALEEGKTVSAEALAGHAIDAKDYPLASEKQGNGTPATLTKGKAKESQPGAPITDIGEKIGGARKDVWQSYKDKLADAIEVDIKAEPLSKSWPAPDYDALLESGADPYGVAFMHAARDEIPTKPSIGYKLTRWVGQVKLLRDVAAKIADGSMSASMVRAELGKVPALIDIAGRIELYMAVGHSQSLRGVGMSAGIYGIYNGVEYNPPKTIWTVDKKAKASSFSNWPRQLASGATKEEALSNFKEKFASLEIDPPASKEIKFEVYSTRGENGYRVGKKMGRNPILLSESFATVKEARAYLRDNQAELVKNLEAAKQIPNERRDTNEPRVGEDMRDGRDVTPQMFIEAFGFRGVEFGNWVEQRKRQNDLNEAYDALMDMAGIIGVSPRALSLNGELGLAFGARGSGGKSPAKAHYEPGRIVVNLTKKDGAGSIGHEWWHALDNYFSRMRGNKADFTTEALDVSLASRGSEFIANTPVRKEMIVAFGRVMGAIKSTALKARSARLDAKRSKDYWSTGLEMSARAYESYLISKLQDQNASNDYLANIVSEETWAAAEKLGFELDESYPYPTAGEVPAIREAFDHFFQTIETKETDTGIALFKRSDDAAIPESEWLSEAAVAQVVEERLAQFSHQPPVLIRDSEADVGTVSDAVASGMVRGGNIYLFRDGMADTAEVTRTLWHEMLHYGLRRFLTKEQYIASMKRLYDNDAWIKASADSWLAQSGADTKKAQAKGNDYALARGVDEALAELGESNAGEFSNNSLKARALRTVARWIAMLADRFGFKTVAAEWRGITNDDARELVKTIFSKLRDDAPATSDDFSFTADSTYSRRVPSGPSSPQQPMRFSSPPGFKFDPETAIEGVQRKHQDSMNRWAKVQRQIAEQGGTVGMDEDVYHAMERMSGRAADRIDQFTHATIKPLLSRMTELKTGLDEIGTYLMALGAKDRNAYIQTIRQDMPDSGSGVSDAEAAQIIDDYKSRPDFAKFDELARDFQQITDRKLKVLVGGGVITQQQATQAQQDFGFYVPYKGFEKIDETGQRGNGTGLGYSTPNRASKRAFGRVSKAGQVVENIIRDYEAAIILAEKVNVGRYARALADANPDPALWTVDQPASQPVMTGGSVALMQAQFDAENEIRYIENGKAVRIQLHDPLLAQTYNNLGQEPLNTLLRAGDALNRVLRQTYTQKNPAFIFVNAMRDIQTGIAAITGEMGAASAIKSLKHAPGAWRAASAESLNRGSVTGEWAKYMAAYRKSGAAVAYYAIGDIEAKQTKLNELLAREGGLSLLDQWKQKGGGLAGAKASAKLAFWRTYNNAVVDVIEALNGGFENMMRLSAFRQYIDEHGGIDNVSRETLAEASRIAKNLTVNFNRKGEKTRAMNAAYLFWNANVQGSQNLYRIATKSIHNKQVKALMGSMVGLGFLMSMTTDDEDDELTPGYVKNTSIVLHIDGKRIQIPLAYGLGYFVAMGYEMGSLVKGRQTPIRTGVNMLSSALMHFSPLGTPIHDGDTDMKSLAIAGTPTILKPIVMSATNRNSMGYEVVPKYDDEAPDRPAMRANTRGGVYDKTAGGLEAVGLDVSPESIKMATTFIAGGLGTFLADSVSASMAGSKGEFDPEKTPILKRFYGVNDIEEHRARFYDQTEDVQTQAREQGKKQKEFFGSNKSEDSVQDFRKVMKELREEEMDAFSKNNFQRAGALQDKQIKLATRFKVLHDRMIKNGRIEKR